LDDLLEASIPAQRKDASAALAADWTDVETFARPPRHGSTECADPEASWGHRNSNLPGPKGEMFFGFYLSAGTMTREEAGPAVPELARRMTLTSCRLDPARALVAVLTRMPAAGVRLGDILDDSGYAYRDAVAWAIPLRAAGAPLIQDLPPNRPGARRPPPGSHHRQRHPVLPRHAETAAEPRAAGPRHPPRAGHRARPAGSRTRPAPARPGQARPRRPAP